MNKTLLIVLVALVLVVGGYFYFTGEQNEMVQDTTSGEVTQKPTGKKIAFTEFIKQGGSYKCTVNQNTGDTETSGTMFISKDLMRGMFETNTQGAKVSSNILVRDGFTYSWSSAMPQGVKMAVVKGETTPNENIGTSGTYSWNADQIGDYDCEAWNADQATFAVPSNIEFMDLADLGVMYKR